MLLTINISILILAIIFFHISVWYQEYETITFPIMIILFASSFVMGIINLTSRDIKHTSYIKPSSITRTLHSVVLENDSVSSNSDLIKFYKMDDKELCIKKIIYTNNYGFDAQEIFEVDKCK
jgi:hypothetical protein